MWIAGADLAGGRATAERAEVVEKWVRESVRRVGIVNVSRAR
jgi:hypothetical protein